jgi:molecular chaperone HscB
MLDFSKTYFELFGLPTAYTVDTEVLAERYRQLQRVVHPDRYANASEQERRLSVQGSSHINEALETLKNPLARARYLLLLNGIDIDANKQSTSDMGFLMEQMQWREALDEARSKPDPYAVTAQVMEHLQEHRQRLIDSLNQQFGDPTPEHLEQAQENVRKMQFLEKLRLEAENLEAELDEEFA